MLLVLVGYFLALIVSFYLLAQVSDKYFVVSLDKIAERFKMSHDMAGATLMAIGSSAPELFVALISVFRSGGAHKEIGIGTIVGSALFNILVIIGASAMVRKAVLVWQPVLRDLLFYIISIIALFIVFIDGHITLWESITLISIYLVYLFAVRNWRRYFSFTELDFIEEEEEEEEYSGFMKIFFPFDYALSKFYPDSKHYFLNFMISIAMIALLSWVLVESAINISHILEVPEVIIALTVLAVGTSIPDLMSSIIVAKQGRGGMAVSNAVGSNIFDILIGLGLPWLLVITLSGDDGLDTAKDGLMESIVLLFGSVIFIFIILVIGKWKMTKITGTVLVGLYIIYLIYSGLNMI